MSGYGGIYIKEKCFECLKTIRRWLKSISQRFRGISPPKTPKNQVRASVNSVKKKTKNERVVNPISEKPRF